MPGMRGARGDGERLTCTIEESRKKLRSCKEGGKEKRNPADTVVNRYSSRRSLHLAEDGVGTRRYATPVASIVLNPFSMQFPSLRSAAMYVRIRLILEKYCRELCKKFQPRLSYFKAH